MKDSLLKIQKSKIQSKLNTPYISCNYDLISERKTIQLCKNIYFWLIVGLNLQSLDFFFPNQNSPYIDVPRPYVVYSLWVATTECMHRSIGLQNCNSVMCIWPPNALPNCYQFSWTDLGSCSSWIDQRNKGWVNYLHSCSS